MFKNIFGPKKPSNVTEVKKNIRTADNIISSAVKNTGNISGVTLNKKEQKALLKKRKKVPVHILMMKYTSIILFAGMLGGVAYLTADLDEKNGYLGLLGLPENTGSYYKKIKQENIDLGLKVSDLTKDIDDYEHRLDNDLFGKNSDTVESIKNSQKTWYGSSKFSINAETGKNETIIKYGVLDSVDEMIKYFKSSDYQTKYFAQKELGLTGSNYEDCKNPRISAGRKDQLNCPKNSNMFSMVNEITLKNISINESGANINVEVSDILNKIFTLGSEFVEMMNSFNFYKNGEVNAFTQRSGSSGEKSMDLAIHLEHQLLDEEDPDDENFIFFQTWKKNSGIKKSTTKPSSPSTKNSSSTIKRKSSPSTRKATPKQKKDLK